MDLDDVFYTITLQLLHDAEPNDTLLARHIPSAKARALIINGIKRAITDYKYPGLNTYGEADDDPTELDDYEG